MCSPRDKAMFVEYCKITPHTFLFRKSENSPIFKAKILSHILVWTKSAGAVDPNISSVIIIVCIVEHVFGERMERSFSFR
jgi:hypothetical protein